MLNLDAVFVRLTSSASRQHFTLTTRDRECMQVRGKEAVLAHTRDFIGQRLAPAQPAMFKPSTTGKPTSLFYAC